MKHMKKVKKYKANILFERTDQRSVESLAKRETERYRHKCIFILVLWMN